MGDSTFDKNVNSFMGESLLSTFSVLGSKGLDNSQNEGLLIQPEF